MSGGGFISVCSGIEAVSEAWRDLPLGPVLYSEIEPFPKAVLAKRHPGVRVWGDFTSIRIRHLLRLGIDLESVEILIGGTPCQSFSIAGLRGGMSDARGNLALEFIRLADAIDNFRRHRGLKPIIIAWENVEGVFSVGGNAFGCFLGGLAGSGAPLVPTGRARWSDAGLVDGPRRTAAWRLLDAQYFGLAQRRRRVLVVASARKGCPGEILFESEGVRRDSPPRRKARQDIAPTIGARTKGGGGLGTDFEIDGGMVRGDEVHAPEISGCLSTSQQRIDAESETFITHSLRAEGFDASEDGTGRGTPLAPDVMAFDCKASGQNGFGVGDIAPTLRAMGHRKSHQNAGGQVAVALSIRGREGGGTAEIADDGDVCPAIRASGGVGDKPHALIETGVRRLTPVECERLQGCRDNYTLVEYRGKPASDGPRYRALGNSMPVPMMRWLGARISATQD